MEPICMRIGSHTIRFVWIEDADPQQGVSVTVYGPDRGGLVTFLNRDGHVGLTELVIAVYQGMPVGPFLDRMVDLVEAGCLNSGYVFGGCDRLSLLAAVVADCNRLGLGGDQAKPEEVLLCEDYETIRQLARGVTEDVPRDDNVVTIVLRNWKTKLWADTTRMWLLGSSEVGPPSDMSDEELVALAARHRRDNMFTGGLQARVVFVAYDREGNLMGQRIVGYC